jgi:ABC-2 type transport system ATP-binding protein
MTTPLPAVLTAPATPAVPAVELAGLVKSYGSVRAVDGVDLRVGAGEVVALLGPNGAGKSTTLDVILGLATPDAGTARILGAAPAVAVRRGLVAGMLQSGELLGDVTVAEIVRLVASLHEHPLGVDEALERADITGLARRRVDKLSGGQGRRVRFAMALVADPALIVLDEPTTGMDITARVGFWARMRALAAEGRTILFATHHLDEADENADRIVLLSSGRVAADGSTTEIRAAGAHRTVRATLPGADRTVLAALPGVATCEIRGRTVMLRCTDSDRALRALLAAEPGARDVEVAGADLTDAFLALTAGDDR